MNHHYLNLSAEDCAASLEVVSCALDAINSGEWSPEQPQRNANGVRGCVIYAVWQKHNELPEAGLSALCAQLLFDFEKMACLRVALAKAFVLEQSQNQKNCCLSENNS